MWGAIIEKASAPCDWVRVSCRGHSPFALLRRTRSCTRRTRASRAAGSTRPSSISPVSPHLESSLGAFLVRTSRFVATAGGMAERHSWSDPAVQAQVRSGAMWQKMLSYFTSGKHKHWKPRLSTCASLACSMAALPSRPHRLFDGLRLTEWRVGSRVGRVAIRHHSGKL